MVDTTERAEQEKARNRALFASIVEGLRTILEGDEQLLAFARGRLAGGWRGKLTIGPEAFFAPFINLALTDRRFLLQHIHPEDGKPSEILPHAFPLTEIVSISFGEIETFGKDVAGRLNVHLNNEQYCRIRLHGKENVDNARALVEVYRSLTIAKRATTSPTQSVCAQCGHILDQPSKFCPYCGSLRADAPPPPAAPENVAPTEPVAETPEPVVETESFVTPAETIETVVETTATFVVAPEPVVDTTWTTAPEPPSVPEPPEPPAPPEPPTPPSPPAPPSFSWPPSAPEPPAPSEAPTETPEAAAKPDDIAELADEIHRFTEEGGSPPAVEHDDDPDLSGA